MRTLFLTLLFATTISAIFSCHKTAKEDRIIIDYMPGIPLFWQGQQSSFGAASPVFSKPDSTTILVLNPDKSYWIQGDRSIGQRGTYKFDTTQTPITGGSILIDSFLVLTPGPTLSKEVKLGDRLHCFFRNDTVYLQSLITPGGFSLNIFKIRQ